jgi:hypothetical protein
MKQSENHWPKRWTKLIAHHEQIKLKNDDKRFKVCAAGRRSGKTERAKRKLVTEAFRTPGLYFAAAPTYNQVKRIYWKDLKLLTPEWFQLKKPSESELTIYLKNGSEIQLIGMDKPARIEGVPWCGGVGDEYADWKPEAWKENLRPALSTPGLNAWCWLTGVPDGLNHFYDQAEYAKTSGDSEWGFYTWKSSDILDKKEIEAAKRELDSRTFKQEYEASFETATGKIYEDYSDLNSTDREFNPGSNIIWSHDFNFLPLSSFIAQQDSENTYCVDEIVLDHAIARQAAEEFVERYKDHKRCKVYLYGDPAGKAGEKHGHISDYIEMENVLRRAGFTVERKVLRSTRSIKDSQASLRSRLCNALGERRFFVNPRKCPTLDKGLKTVQAKKGSTFLEDESNPSQHITTAARYFTEYEFPIYGKPKVTIR